MAKIKKAVLALVLAALACVSLLLTGCSDGGAEIKGVYYKNDCMHSAIEQGKLVQSISSCLTIYSDNTFAANAISNSIYSSDGTSYNPVFFVAYTVYGSYEVVNEDALLKETTIKIIDVQKPDTKDGTIEKTAFEADVAAAIEDDIIGLEIILMSDFAMSESFATGAMMSALR